jgi:hypothetical protein
VAKKKVNFAPLVMLDSELSLMEKQLKLITAFSVSDEKQ